MRVAIILFVCAVCGCQTPILIEGSGDRLSQESSQNAERLPAQFLDRGQCGIFLFSVREPNNFIFFENQSLAKAKFLFEGKVAELYAEPIRETFILGERFSLFYTPKSKMFSVQVSGDVGANTASGQILAGVILTLQRADGMRVSIPLSGVRRCA